jgi:hypothetical protein
VASPHADLCFLEFTFCNLLLVIHLLLRNFVNANCRYCTVNCWFTTPFQYGDTVTALLILKHSGKPGLGMVLQCNTEARSRNRCYHGKAISRPITYSECVCNLSYQARNAHVPCYIAMRPDWLCHIFPRYLINRFSGKKLLNIHRVF